MMYSTAERVRHTHYLIGRPIEREAMQTVAVTGGNGKIGRAILRELNEHGYRTVNLARGPRREDESDRYLTTDLLDAGDVYGSLATSGADAVIHMGTIPAPILNPGFVTFESNVTSSYHVLEAGTSLGLDSICLASSINVMGCAYQSEPTEVYYLPVDEKHPLTPRDPYALGKHVLEVTADGFGRLADAPTISSLRYPWVATDDELRGLIAQADRSIEGLAASGTGSRDALFSYLHVEDAASVARLAVEADFVGHEAFWAVAADTSTPVPNETLVAEFYPDVDVRAPLEDALIDVGKADRLLGWKPVRSWRNV